MKIGNLEGMEKQKSKTPRIGAYCENQEKSKMKYRKRRKQQNQNKENWKRIKPRILFEKALNLGVVKENMC